MNVIYRPIGSLSAFIQVVYVMFAFLSGVAVVTGWSYRSALLDLADGDVVLGQAVQAEDAYLAAGGLVAGINIVVVVAFLIWFWRAYANLRALGRETRRKPGWAIGSWFIPIGNFFIPYGIGAEIWKKSAVAGIGAPYRDDGNVEPVISWWALFLIMGLVSQVAFFSSRGVADDPEKLAAAVGIDLVGSVVGIAAAIAAGRFVRLATQRQEALLMHSGVAG